MDPVEEQVWLDEQEANILRYLGAEGIVIDHDLQIEWGLAPIVSLWRTQSRENRILWIVSGDLPTDFVDDASLSDARAAMAMICARWLEVAGFILKAKQHPTIHIGSGLPPPELKTLGDLLKRRATTLQSWTSSDAKWAEGTA
jgi:hypothetical protein